MSDLVSVIRRNQLVTFFLVAYLLSWWTMLVEAGGIFAWGPLLAALSLLPVVSGREGLLDFLKRIVSWRVGARWYGLVLLLPPAVCLAAIGSNVLLGARSPGWTAVPPLTQVVPTFLVVMLIIGLGEEPAWRGFALPRLLEFRSALGASLLLGVLHALWHLPLFGSEFTLRNGLPWLASVLAVAIIATWIYLHTQGYLLLPILLHTSVNVSARYLFFPLFEGSDLARLWWIWATIWVLFAVVLAVTLGPRLIRRRAGGFGTMPAQGVHQ